MPRIDIAKIPERQGSSYPSPFDAPCRTRKVKRLGEAGGLTQLGVTLATLPPGAWSSQRHWHQLEDEFMYVVSGEVVVVTDAGEEVARAGDCFAWPMGVRDGHHVQNRSQTDAVLLAMSNRDDADVGEYPDLDLTFGEPSAPGQSGFFHKDGTPY